MNGTLNLSPDPAYASRRSQTFTSKGVRIFLPVLRLGVAPRAPRPADEFAGPLKRTRALMEAQPPEGGGRLDMLPHSGPGSRRVAMPQPLSARLPASSLGSQQLHLRRRWKWKRAANVGIMETPNVALL